MVDFKSFFNIVFRLIVRKAKPMKLQTLCFIYFKEIKPKMTSYKLKILGFFLDCRFSSTILLYLASVLWISTHANQFWHLYIRFSSAKHISCYNYVSSWIRSKQNCLTKLFTKSALKLCNWNSRSYKNATPKLLDQGRKAAKSLKRHWGSISSLKPSLHTKNHPL